MQHTTASSVNSTLWPIHHSLYTTRLRPRPPLSWQAHSTRPTLPPLLAGTTCLGYRWCLSARRYPPFLPLRPRQVDMSNLNLAPWRPVVPIRDCQGDQSAQMPLQSQQYKVVLELVSPASVRAVSSRDSHYHQARSKVPGARLRDPLELLIRPRRKLWTSSRCLRISPKAVQQCHRRLSRPSRLQSYHALPRWQPPVFPSLQALRSQLPRLVLRARMSILRQNQNQQSI
jgi:hypothetical protein